MAEIFNLDPIDVNNIGRFPENMQFRNVNDGGRALEGMLARWFRDTNGSLAASGYQQRLRGDGQPCAVGL